MTTTTKTAKTFNINDIYKRAIISVSNHNSNIEVHTSIKGNEYKGLNLKLLDLRAKKENYSDNTWLTQKDMDEMDLTFKDDKQYGVQLFTKKDETVRYYTVYNRQQLVEDNVQEKMLSQIINEQIEAEKSADKVPF